MNQPDALPPTPPPWEDLKPLPYEPGPVEVSVLRDIERVGQLDKGVRGSLKEMAVKLARAFDLCETDDITALAKLNAELRQTLSRLTEVGSDKGTAEALFAALSKPHGGACSNCGHQD